MAPLTVEDWLN